MAYGDAWLTPGGKCAALELRLIRNCTPLFNVAMTNWWTDLEAVEYAAHREAWDIVDDLLDILSCGDRVTGRDAAGLRPPPFPLGTAWWAKSIARKFVEECGGRAEPPAAWAA